MKKLITTKAKAQAAANKCHEYLISNNSDYSRSVSNGGTIAWCIPHQDLETDDKGNLHLNVTCSDIFGRIVNTWEKIYD